jgi:hypothetical protein
VNTPLPRQGHGDVSIIDVNAKILKTKGIYFKIIKKLSIIEGKNLV